jgi:hypothetical protein
MRRLSNALVTAAAIVLASPPTAGAELADLFKDPRFANLNLAPLAGPLAATVASTYPVASASSGVAFVYNPALDAVERRPGVLGPILGERAETVGAGQFDVGIGYAFVDLETINGEPLDDLVNAPSLQRRFIFFPVPGGTTLRDGRQTTILPVRVSLDIDLTAHLLSPSVTYGVTPDLDVNLTVPLVHTALAVRTSTRVPDPRRPAFALPRGSPDAGTVAQGVSADESGVGDLLLRAKYVLYRGSPVDVAMGLGLGLPSGRDGDFHGTGTTRVQPLLIASRRFAERVELLANLGSDLNADEVERSTIRWAVGGTARLMGGLAASVTFLGRHELEAQADRIRLPFFFQIERNDTYDASVGFRWQFADAGVVSTNAIVPLNGEGLRADVIPMAQIEYAFP